MLRVIDDVELLQSYLTDASNTNGSAQLVYVPENIADVQEAVRRCIATSQPLHISGNGTGLVGGRVASTGALLSLERMQGMHIDTERNLAHVEAGISMRDVQAAVSSAGLLYPPDPTEWSAAMGGTWATNASGARTFKYGATRRYIHAIRVVLANADILELRRGESVARGYELTLVTTNGHEIAVPVPRYTMPKTSKHAAGYYAHENLDAIDLFIGSEGSLGIIVDAELQLLPQPERVLGAIIFFEGYDRMLDAVEELRATRAGRGVVAPRLVEFFDRHALDFIAGSYPSIPADSQCSVWIEQEFEQKQEDEVYSAWADFVSRHTALADECWFAYDDRRHAEFRAFRHALPSAIYEHISEARQSKIGTDVAVPAEKFREFFSFYQKLFADNAVRYVLFGHIGDAHLHANMFTSDTMSYERSMDLYGALITKGLELGGTVSAEHGIGKLKKKYLLELWGNDGIEQMRAVKRALDPMNLLSPGNMFDM